MANVIYNSFKRDIQNGAIDLDTDTINVMLVSNLYSPNIDTHTKRSDVTANEISGAGYSAGGATLGSKTVAVDNTDDEGVFDAANPTWAGSTLTARGAVLYKSRGGASSADELICYLDFGADVVSSNGVFEIVFDPEGILNLG